MYIYIHIYYFHSNMFFSQLELIRIKQLRMLRKHRSHRSHRHVRRTSCVRARFPRFELIKCFKLIDSNQFELMNAFEYIKIYEEYKNTKYRYKQMYLYLYVSMYKYMYIYICIYIYIIFIQIIASVSSY